MNTLWEILSAIGAIGSGVAAVAAFIAIYKSSRANDIARAANDIAQKAASEAKEFRIADEAPRIILDKEIVYPPDQCYVFEAPVPLKERSVSVGRMLVKMPGADSSIATDALIINASRYHAEPSYKFDNFAEIHARNIGNDLIRIVVKRLIITFPDGRGDDSERVIELIANPTHNSFEGVRHNTNEIPFLISYRFDPGEDELVDMSQPYKEILNEKIHFAGGDLFSAEVPRLIDTYRKLEFEIETENIKGAKYSQTVSIEVIKTNHMSRYVPDASVPKLICED